MQTARSPREHDTLGACPSWVGTQRVEPRALHADSTLNAHSQLPNLMERLAYELLFELTNVRRSCRRSTIGPSHLSVNPNAATSGRSVRTAIRCALRS